MNGAPGTAIVAQGDPDAKDFFIVASGAFEVSVSNIDACIDCRGGLLGPVLTMSAVLLVLLGLLVLYVRLIERYPHRLRKWGGKIRN